MATESEHGGGSRSTGAGASATDLEALAARLAADGVQGLTIAWADNNGIPRSRTVPVARLADSATWGVGITTLFAVFDSHDGITFEHEGLATPSGDIRLLSVPERICRLAGQPAFAWAPGRQVDADGAAWPYDQRGVLERQVARAAELGFELQAGYEIELFAARDSDVPQAAVRGPAYSPHTLLEVDEFVAQLLHDLAANGIEIGQVHAEYGRAQIELSLPARDPVAAADDQLLARQTIHAAARAHGLRAILAPLVTTAGIGNGWHVHTSLLRDGVNLLDGDGPHGLSPVGASYIAGILRDLPAVVAITAPSLPSLLRLRPGYFSSAYAFWGIQNREAALRYVPGSQLVGGANANVELKPCDASANPYLALAAVIAAGLAGVEDSLTLPDPIQENPGAWTADQRARLGVVRLPQTPAEQDAALRGCARLGEALGTQLTGAFLAVRRADAAWGAGKTDEEIVEAHLWRY